MYYYLKHEYIWAFPLPHSFCMWVTRLYIGEQNKKESKVPEPWEGGRGFVKLQEAVVEKLK